MPLAQHQLPGGGCVDRPCGTAPAIVGVGERGDRRGKEDRRGGWEHTEHAMDGVLPQAKPQHAQQQRDTQQPLGVQGDILERNRRKQTHPSTTR